jgi:putative ABC transport system permease protein
MKIGWRHIAKHKSLFAINTIGLAIGLATCLIIILFIADELSYDRYNEKANQIVRVVLKGNINGEIVKEAVTQAPVAYTLQREFPEVLQGTRLKGFGTPQVTYQNNTFRDSKLASVDANFFSIFSLPFVKGNPKTALLEPNTIIITEDEAVKYFGNENPIGKILEFKEWNEQYKVTGTIEKVPENSHFHFDLFTSMEGLKRAKKTSWIESEFQSYLLLNEDCNPKELESKLPVILDKYMGGELRNALGMSLAEFKEKGNKIGLFLQPLTDIHLYSDFSSITELEAGGNIKTLYIFGVIAIFILLIACINFMNLSTAAASKRAKEIGIKKVLGSKKKHLVSQFLTESFIATISAMILAVIIVIFTLPLFNELSSKSLEVAHILNVEMLIYFSIFGIFISLISGIYPAFFLSSFEPLTALKSKFTSTGKTKYLRSGLVIFQFIISASLIISTIVIEQQMAFILDKDNGYDKEFMLVIRDSGRLGKYEKAFKEELLKDSRVENISSSGHIPAGPTNTTVYSAYPNQDSDAFRRVFVYDIDEQYIPTMKMKILVGRNFSKEFGKESSSVILNEAALKVFGFKENILDQTVTISTDNQGGTKNLKVIGVVKDFNFKSLHKSIEPLIMLNNPNSGLIIRTKTADMKDLLADIEILWQGFNVGETFNYALLDQLYNQTYLSEQKMGTILRIFALLTIFVACLGLFGLVTFTAEQRVKEIGIRKVLGSTVLQIIIMLSFDFLKLVIMAFLIAFPLGYYLMDNWLQDFAYRINVNWWVFLLAGVITMLIAFLTIGFKSVKVAISNPIDALRNE